jgi:non-homologous end joining protein Ku
MTLAAKEVGGVAKWYAKGRENLVVITGNGESIQVHQMKYENEINKFSPECAKVDVHEQELAFLGLLIDSQTVESYGHSDDNPSLYRDCHAERVREAVNDKRAGVQVKASKKAGSPVGGDLLSMLQASVKNIEVKKHKGKALTQNIVTDANNESYAEGIFENKDGTFQALTPTKSSSFKTRGGAERWLYRATNGRLGKASAGSKK